LSNRKKILVFTDWFVPGFKAGGPIQSLFQMVNHVDQDFFVVTRITDYRSEEPYQNITPRVWTEISSNCKVLYIEEGDLSTSLLKGLQAEIEPDWIYLNSLFSPKFTIFPLRYFNRTNIRSRIIVAPRGMLKSGALSIKSKKKTIFLKLSKWFGWYREVRWHATSETEAEEIKMHFGDSSRIKVAPVLSARGNSISEEVFKQVGKISLVTFSRISSEKGILEAIQFINAIPNEYSVSFDVYGSKNDAAYFEVCEAVSKNSNHVVSFKGEVSPSQIPSILKQAHFFLLATWGENFGHAIAESLINGVPVIISDRTPWRDLEENRAGWDLPLEQQAFVNKLVYAANMDNESYQMWRKGALDMGLKKTNTPEAIGQNKGLFE
jgi:glycosyltransferase involved in cell wall biosynthesis